MKYWKIILWLNFVQILSPAMMARAESEGQKYQHCMALSEEVGQEALKYAREWVFAAGGAAARHCEAAALLSLGRAKDAAQLFEKLIDDLNIGQGLGPQAMANRKMLKIELYIQAAIAWKAAKNYDKAYGAYSNGLLGLKPKASYRKPILLERGALEIIRKNYDAAIEDFTRVIEADATDYRGYLQRAKAFRRKKAYPQARLDLKEANAHGQDNADILLESGILYRSQGKNMQARSEWNKIIRLYQGSEAAKLAQENLSLIPEE